MHRAHGLPFLPLTSPNPRCLLLFTAQRASTALRLSCLGSESRREQFGRWLHQTPGKEPPCHEIITHTQTHTHTHKVQEGLETSWHSDLYRQYRIPLGQGQGRPLSPLYSIPVSLALFSGLLKEPKLFPQETNRIRMRTARKEKEKDARGLNIKVYIHPWDTNTFFPTW